jgi:hypothetical protein
MPQGNPVRLLSLADREFRQLTGKPVAVESGAKFKAMKLNPSRFGKEWDRKRGAAVRLTAVLLREDDATLQARVCENDKTQKTYANADLRRVAGLLETAGDRLSAVLIRCQGAQR